MRRTSLYATCLILSLAVLSGCGIKPTFVDPPQGHTQDTFPQTYPAPSTVTK